MSTRQRAIIRLMKNQEFMTSFQLAQRLNVSDRTIRNEIRSIMDFVKKNGAEISSKTGQGYRLDIIDTDLFQKFIENEDNNLVPSNSEERIVFLLRHFLKNPGYVKIDELCDLLYISKATLQQDLKIAKNSLKEYRLELKSKPNYGLKISGKEFDFRLCLTNFTLKNKRGKDEAIDENEKFILELKALLAKILLQENYDISDFSFNNLAMHLLVTIRRIEQSCFIQMDDDELDNLKRKDEYKIAQKIVQECELLTNIAIPESECGYISIHLTGKHNYNGYANNHKNIVVDMETQQIVDKMLQRIYDTYRVDFREDLQLKMNLYLHLVPLLNRLNYNLVMKNPLREEILRRFSLAYQFAKEVCLVIEEKKEYIISDDEICYFALHLNLALEQQRTDDTKKNVLVVCSTGKGTSELLAYQIHSQFKDSLQTVTACDLLHLKEVDFTKYHYIFSTVPIDFPVPLPIIQIEYFFQDNDVDKIKKIIAETKSQEIEKFFSKDLFLTDIQSDKKNDILKEIVQRIRMVRNIPENYYDSIMERELLAVTEFDNLVAIPHTNEPLSDETFVCVAILNEAIVWEEKKVQFIFLLSIGKNGDSDLKSFYGASSRMIMNKNAIKTLIQSKDFDDMMHILREI
ncbi:MAG: BglG family transcription antiterminator [Anaerorhabdus sp.]